MHPQRTTECFTRRNTVKIRSKKHAQSKNIYFLSHSPAQILGVKKERMLVHMDGKRVVVTGGAGFIGSNLVHRLAEKNQVTVIDDLSTGNINNIKDFVDTKKINFVQGSITDLAVLQKTLKHVDYVFHEAAIPSVPRSVKDPYTSHIVNANGTLNILLAAKENQVKKVIYASSSSVYGDTPTLPKKEDMKPNPLSPYAVSKLTGEYYCDVFTRIYRLPTVSLRYFNVYGPRQDPLSEYAAVFPKFITSVLKGKSPLVYGDGSQTRDFTFVDDVVTVNILAAESPSTGIFNVAGGKRITINELASSIITLCKNDVAIEYATPREGDIKHSLADITRAKEKLNYEPRFNITEGIKETIKWFQKST
jgi:UDP-glucose 4-epimerase